MSIPAIQAGLAFVMSNFETGVIVAVPIVQKVTEVSLYYFDVLRQSCFFVLGADEFYRQGIQMHDKLKEEQVLAIKVHGTFFSRVHYLLKDAEKHILRGAFFLGSGIFGTITALHRLKGVESSHLHVHQILSNVANGLFLAANIISLHICYQQFQEAKRILDRSKDIAECVSATRACESAILGMLSSIGYIIVGGMYVLGGPTTWALVLGCVSTFTGALKAIYDWYYTTHNKAISSLPDDKQPAKA